jgi:hypothetical protein
MRYISAELKAHLAQEQTTIATCWRVLLKNGKMFGFTDHTRDILLTESLPPSIQALFATPISSVDLVYQSSSGYTPSAVQSSSMLNVDNLEIEAILNSPVVQERDLIAGLWDGARVQQFIVNYEDLTMGRMILRSGFIGNITIKNASFVAEVRGLTQYYANNIGELYSPTCRARLGDARCGLSLAAFTTTGTVDTVNNSTGTVYSSAITQPGGAYTSSITGISQAQRAVVTTSGAHGFINGDVVYIDGVQGVVQVGSPGVLDPSGTPYFGTGATLNGQSFVIADVTSNSFSIPVDTRTNGTADGVAGPLYNMIYSPYQGGGTVSPQGESGYFAYGTVTFTSGLNAGLSMEVKQSAPGGFVLQLPMPYDIAPGDTFSAVAGCSGRFKEDCQTKFNNVINFRGEPYLPGLDHVLQYGTQPLWQAQSEALASDPSVTNTGGGVV